MAISAITGAAPVPVPPPMPAAMGIFLTIVISQAGVIPEVSAYLLAAL